MEEENNFISFDLICPECGVGNPQGAKSCLVCDKNLEDTVAFMEDDSFDLEITSECLLIYRKNFWGTRRTGKIKKYLLNNMMDVQFGSPINRFVFIYDDLRVVIPLKDENMEMMKKLFKEHEHQ